MTKDEWKEEGVWYWNRFLGTIKRPFRWLQRHIFNRAWWHLFSMTLKAEPWDYAYQLQIEKASLLYMIDWHRQHGISADRKRYIRDMQICCNLIDLITEDEQPELRCCGCHDQVNRPFNMNNAHRFASKSELSALRESQYYKALFMESIYRSKAQQLYHKIRTEHEREWWD